MTKVVIKDGETRLLFAKTNKKGDYIKDSAGEVEFYDPYEEAVAKFGKELVDSSKCRLY